MSILVDAETKVICQEPTSPCKGEVESRGSGFRVGVQCESRFNRTKQKTTRARELRKNASDAEARLWRRLRANQLDGLSFRRQHPAGVYVLDFYCPQLRLAIELDGGQHAEEGHRVKDKRRTAWLAECGVTVIRFWNFDVHRNLNGVLEQIKSVADELRAAGRTPTRRWRADLPLSGGGEGERCK